MERVSGFAAARWSGARSLRDGAGLFRRGSRAMVSRMLERGGARDLSRGAVLGRGWLCRRLRWRFSCGGPSGCLLSLLSIAFVDSHGPNQMWSGDVKARPRVSTENGLMGLFPWSRLSGVANLTRSGPFKVLGYDLLVSACQSGRWWNSIGVFVSDV